MRLTFLIAILVALVLLVYMFCFQVRYDEIAVVTTFDRATAPTYGEDGEVVSPGSVKFEPGLYFRWPWPVDKVKKYSRLLQVLDGVTKETPTSDNRLVVARMFITWRISDPYKFFVRLRDEANAASQLGTILQAAQSDISQFKFEELVNTDPSQLRIDDLESQALEKIRRDVAEQDYGVEIVQFGIRRLVLPEDITPTVFERMKKDREALAQNIRSSGEADAKTIRDRAEATRSRIESFARSRAEAIIAQGAIEAARELSKFAQDEPLAIALERIRTIEQILKNRAVVVLSAEQLQMDNLFPSWGSRGGPGADASGGGGESVDGSAEAEAGAPSTAEGESADAADEDDQAAMLPGVGR